MQLVTDSGVDISLPAAERETLSINVVPLQVTLDGKSYREGIDITKAEF